MRRFRCCRTTMRWCPRYDNILRICDSRVALQVSEGIMHLDTASPTCADKDALLQTAQQQKALWVTAHVLQVSIPWWQGSSVAMCRISGVFPSKYNPFLQWGHQLLYFSHCSQTKKKCFFKLYNASQANFHYFYSSLLRIQGSRASLTYATYSIFGTDFFLRPCKSALELEKDECRLSKRLQKRRISGGNSYSADVDRTRNCRINGGADKVLNILCN